MKRRSCLNLRRGRSATPFRGSAGATARPIAKESSATVHDGLASIFGHHWVGHGILDLIVFLVLGFVLSRGGRNMTANGVVKVVVGGTVIGGLIIVGFFGLK